MKSTPVSAIRRTLPRLMLPEASIFTRPPRSRTAFLIAGTVMLSSMTQSAPAAAASERLVDRRGFDLDPESPAVGGPDRARRPGRRRRRPPGDCP